MRVYELVAMRLAQVDAVVAGHASPPAGEPSGGGTTT
jgi:hypothetical protein